jgi:hypothetical protein
MSKEIIYWTMKNGKKISVDDMDINHLRNTLKMIIRNVNKKDAIDQMMFDELDNPDLLY